MARRRPYRGSLSSLALLALALSASGCRAVRHVATRYPRADLTSIYARSAPDLANNPVVLIPGFAGSILSRREDDKTVWGAFFTQDALSWSQPPGLRALALDVRGLGEAPRVEELAWIEDDTEATGVLARARAGAVVTHFSFNVYATLLELLRRAGYVIDDDPARGADAPPPNCFTFVYDWRQDAVTNAVRLGDFLDETAERVRTARRRAGLAEAPVRFDLVAHSMGGLVARYYLRYGPHDVLGETDPPITWEGASRVDRLILVSTPNLGSMKVFRDLVYGRGHPILPTLEAALVATMVSVYQMLPRPAQPVWLAADGTPTDLPVWEARTWVENGWGPFAQDQERVLAWLYPTVRSATARRERMESFMRAAFERARHFARALDRHPDEPPPTLMALFTGDADPTLERARFIERRGALVPDFGHPQEDHLMAPGDGTVSRASALADERLGAQERQPFRSPVQWDWTVFISDRHATFLGNPTFQDNLLHLLLERPPKRAHARP